ncbi:MAG: amidohydrolase family protein [Devosia sp.]|jgi:predicted TIM-barrel fold metal-dependent hydrolase|nr:amidohydrolase family protein [Devosia sp.]
MSSVEPTQSVSSAVIDVHHHVFPPAYIAAHRADILAISNGNTWGVEWTPEKSLREMDQAGVSKAILSISAPGVWFGDDQKARSMARACNEYAAELVSRRPDRFGFFAAVPLPDVEGALAESAYAMDHLGAAGVGVLTNYEGLYLGEEHFSRLFAELNGRKTAIFVHPTECACCAGAHMPMPSAFIELPFDTTRTAASLLFSKTLARFRDLRFIFSHGGGALPMLAGRMGLWAFANPELMEMFPQGLQPELARHYYDTVTITSPPAIAALKAFAPPGQLLFGTDFPIGPLKPQLDAIGLFEFPDADHRGVTGANAASLLKL